MGKKISKSKVRTDGQTGPDIPILTLLSDSLSRNVRQSFSKPTEEHRVRFSVRREVIRPKREKGVHRFLFFL